MPDYGGYSRNGFPTRGRVQVGGGYDPYAYLDATTASQMKLLGAQGVLQSGQTAASQSFQSGEAATQRAFQRDQNASQLANQRLQQMIDAGQKVDDQTYEGLRQMYLRRSDGTGGSASPTAPPRPMHYSGYLEDAQARGDLTPENRAAIEAQQAGGAPNANRGASRMSAVDFGGDAGAEILRKYNLDSLPADSRYDKPTERQARVEALAAQGRNFAQTPEGQELGNMKPNLGRASGDLAGAKEQAARFRAERLAAGQSPEAALAYQAQTGSGAGVDAFTAPNQYAGVPQPGQTTYMTVADAGAPPMVNDARPALSRYAEPVSPDTGLLSGTEQQLRGLLSQPTVGQGARALKYPQEEQLGIPGVNTVGQPAIVGDTRYYPDSVGGGLAAPDRRNPLTAYSPPLPPDMQPVNPRAAMLRANEAGAAEFASGGPATFIPTQTDIAQRAAAIRGAQNGASPIQPGLGAGGLVMGTGVSKTTADQYKISAAQARQSGDLPAAEYWEAKARGLNPEMPPKMAAAAGVQSGNVPGSDTASLQKAIDTHLNAQAGYVTALHTPAGQAEEMFKNPQFASWLNARMTALANAHRDWNSAKITAQIEDEIHNAFAASPQGIEAVKHTMGMSLPENNLYNQAHELKLLVRPYIDKVLNPPTQVK